MAKRPNIQPEHIQARVTPAGKALLVEMAYAAGSSPSRVLAVLLDLAAQLPEDARSGIAARFTAARGLNLLARSPCDHVPARAALARKSIKAQRAIAHSLIDAIWPEWPDELADGPDLAAPIAPSQERSE